MTHQLPLRFLICSRPEHNIRMRFERSDLQSATTRLVLDMDDAVTQDITTFLEAEFSRVHREHCIQETSWPAEGVIQSLAKRASEQFIYASTVIKFIDDRDFQPQQRLDMILGTVPHGIFSPFADIDLLYTQILDTVPPSKIKKTLLLLWMIIYGIHLPTPKGMRTDYSSFLNQLFQFNSGGVEYHLRELHSVLDVQKQISVYHKSFSDFLSCKTRSGRYSTEKEIVWGEMLGLFWACIPQWWNQFPNALPGDKESWVHYARMWLVISCANILITHSLLALHAMKYKWKHYLPESRHAGTTLQELANIAGFLEKKASDTPQSKIVLYLGEKFSDFYPTIISWLSKEVCGMVFTYLSG